MPRADPRRSEYCAARHLLRNLHHRSRLRRNPLVGDAMAGAPVDDAVSALERRVGNALESAGPRGAAILLRVDVRRHPAAGVAADLGLSQRQFYRERRNAYEAFLRAFRSNGVRCTIAAVQTATPPAGADFAAQLLQRAQALADAGEPASAAAILRDLCGTAKPTLRARAAIAMADIDVWAHRFDRARRRVDDARRLMSAEGLECDGQLIDAAEAVELELRWFAGGPSAVEPVSAGPRTALVRAAAALRGGDANFAARLLTRFQAMASDVPARIDALTLEGELADFTAEDSALSQTSFERAASLARRHGFIGRALYAEHQRALTQWMQSRRVADRQAYRRLVDRVDVSQSPRLRSYLLFSAADTELAIGHPQRALALAHSAEAVCTNAYESLSAQGLAAGAMLRLDRIDEAGAAATEVTHAARRHGHARVLSLAQRISAQALLAKGNRRAARAAIEESIECARHFSSAHVLSTARAVLAQIRA